MKEQCKNCGKELKDEASLKRGFGPECWNKQKAKGTLPILVTFRTGSDKADLALFDPFPSHDAPDLVIAFDASIFGNYGSSWNSGIEITDEIRSRGLFPWIGDEIWGAWQHGNLEVSMYARKHLIPAKTLPELPPDMMNKKQIEALSEFEEEWVPIMCWNTQRIELISLKPKKWELIKNKIALVLSNEFNTGTMFVEDDAGEDVSEKYADIYGDKDWVPTMEFENWMDGPKNRFWVENPHMKYLKSIIQNKNIVLKTDDSFLDEVVGDEWKTSDEAYAYMERMQMAFAHDHMCCELEDFGVTDPEWPLQKIKDSWYGNPFRWCPELEDFDGDIADLDEDRLEILKKAILLGYAGDIYAIWFASLTVYDGEGFHHLSNGMGSNAVSDYKHKTTDSLLVQEAKITIWNHHCRDLIRHAEQMWHDNMELEYETEWEFNDNNALDAYNMFRGKGHGSMPNPLDWDELGRIKKTMTNAAEGALKKLIISVFKTDNEIFAKADYD